MSNPPSHPSVWIILAPALFVSGLVVLLFIFARKDRRPPEVGLKGIFHSNGNAWSWVVLALILLAVALALILCVPTVG